MKAQHRCLLENSSGSTDLEREWGKKGAHAVVFKSLNNTIQAPFCIKSL